MRVKGDGAIQATTVYHLHSVATPLDALRESIEMTDPWGSWWLTRQDEAMQLISSASCTMPLATHPIFQCSPPNGAHRRPFYPSNVPTFPLG